VPGRFKRAGRPREHSVAGGKFAEKKRHLDRGAKEIALAGIRCGRKKKKGPRPVRSGSRLLSEGHPRLFPPTEVDFCWGDPAKGPARRFGWKNTRTSLETIWSGKKWARAGFSRPTDQQLSPRRVRVTDQAGRPAQSTKADRQSETLIHRQFVGAAVFHSVNSGAGPRPWKNFPVPGSRPSRRRRKKKTQRPSRACAPIVRVVRAWRQRPSFHLRGPRTRRKLATRIAISLFGFGNRSHWKPACCRVA